MHENGASPAQPLTDDTVQKPSRALWIGVIVAFLLAGIMGHDPWKQDETYSFGIIYHFYVTHNWLVPTNAGMPFMEKPPLYYWTAVVFCKLFSPLIPLHDAARLASFFYMLVAVAFMWKLSQMLLGDESRRRDLGWTTIALFIGSVGLARHAHDMFTDVALLASTTIALYGMAMLLCRPQCWIKAGVWLGLGVGMAFMSKGLLVPLLLGCTGGALWLITPALRTRGTLGAALVALALCLPFFVIWPLLLYQHSPELFAEWFWENNIGRFTGSSVERLGAGNKPHYVLYALLWFAFPAFPLASLALVWESPRWRRPAYLLPATFCAVGLAVLLMSASARALYLLPLFPAFALLGAQGLEHVYPKFLARWNLAARFVFSLLIACVWLLWWSLLHPDANAFLHAVARFSRDWFPLDFIPPADSGLTCMFAAVMAWFWAASYRLRPETPDATAYTWLAGVAGLWATANTLLMPWINETKSYRPVIERMEAFLAASPYKDDCIGAYHLGESIPPMLQYFGRLHTPPPVQDDEKGECPLILMDVNKSEPEDFGPHWNLIWKGARVLDTKNMEMRLYARSK